MSIYSVNILSVCLSVMLQKLCYLWMFSSLFLTIFIMPTSWQLLLWQPECFSEQGLKHQNILKIVKLTFLKISKNLVVTKYQSVKRLERPQASSILTVIIILCFWDLRNTKSFNLPNCPMKEFLNTFYFINEIMELSAKF